VTADQHQRRSGMLVVSIALVLGILVVIAGGAGTYVYFQSRSSSEDLTMSHPLSEMSRGDRGPDRQDLEPLTKRFVTLGPAPAATWHGGRARDAGAVL
jgi:hypothetical protein